MNTTTHLTKRPGVGVVSVQENESKRLARFAAGCDEKLSGKALEALIVLLSLEATAGRVNGVTGGTFSRRYWPAAWAAARTTSRRHGLRMRGGVFLSDLMQRGFVDHAVGDGYNVGYKLSALGLRLAKAAAPTGYATPCPGCGRYGHSVCADMADFVPPEEDT